MARELDQAFAAIEETIIPSVSMLLDSLIEAGAMGRPGLDAAGHAQRLRAMASEVDGLTAQLAALAPARPAAQPEPLRIPA